MKGYVFDIKRFYVDLGGPALVHRRLMFMGFDVQLKTVKKWRERNDIALPYLTALFAHRAMNEGPLDFNDYLTPVADLRAPRRPSPAAPVAAPRARQPAALRG